MLYDAIIEAAANPKSNAILGKTYARGVRRVAEVIKKSPKYVMTPLSVQMMQTLAEKRPSSLVKGLPICYLHHSSMWVEYSYYDFQESLRIHNIFDTIPEHKGATPPLRLGYLFEQKGKDRIIVTLAWLHKKMEVEGVMLPEMVHIALSEVHIDLSKTDPIITEQDILNEIDESKQKDGWMYRFRNSIPDIEQFCHLKKRTQFGTSFYMAEFVFDYLDSISNNPKKLKHFEDEMNYDMAGEWRNCLAILMLLNSRNCIEYTEVDRSKLSRNRVKSGKPPTDNFKRMDFKLSRVQQNKYSGSGHKMEDLAKHLVIAHMKVRKSGVYLWNSFVRGYVGEVKFGERIVKP